MLGRRWEPGKATIVAEAELASVDGYSAVQWVAEVQPDSGAPAFRAELKPPLKNRTFNPPGKGAVVRVKFDPKSLHAKFDTSDPSLDLGSVREQEQKDFNAALAAVPGTAAPSSSAGAQRQDGSAADELSGALGEVSAAVAGVAGATSDVSETLAAITRAKAAGDREEVDRLKAEFARRDGGGAGSSGAVGGGGASRVDASDPLERLDRLAGLRDRGVLTDEEFAAEKAKILSGS